MKNRALRVLFGLVSVAAVGRPQGGFGGPSILSRGGGGVGTSRGQAIGVSAYGSLQGIYNWGFSPIQDTTAQAGVLPKLSGGGVMLDGGLVGYYQKQRHATSFAGRGLYANNSSGNSFNNYGVNLELAHSRQVNRKTQFFVSLAGGKTNFTGQFLYRFSEEPVAQTVNPGFEIFDSHLTTASGAAGVTYQKSIRWSFSAQGGAYGADRRERGLADMRGASGTGSAQYSFSRRTSVGGAYTYSYFFFPGQFGETWAQNAVLFLNRAIGRRWSFSVRGGVFQARTERLRTITLDPLIAELTGQTQGLQIFRGTNRGWVGGAELTGRFRNSSLQFLYNRSLQGGNGVYLTSVSDLGTINYTYQARRTWTLGAFVSYSKLSAITQQIGVGSYRTGGGSVSRRINSYLNAVGSAGVFNTDVFNGRFARNRIYVSAGVQFTPRELPILR